VTELEVEGARWLGLSAQQGEATAQCWLGACCAEGRGVPVDKTMAVRWYEAAAAQGHARAQCNLGACYSEGIGVTRDIMQAVKWWEAASAGPQGEPAAQYRLGMLYATGIEVDAGNSAPATTIHVDDDVAFRYFCAAAGQGFVAAHSWLGECYAAGRGCEQSDENAYSCFAAGAVEGDADAQYAVGIRLLAGKGVEVDKQAGAQWLEMAARAGHVRSQARFGWSWVNGETGAGPDIDTAKSWWSLAAAQGESVALPLASYQVPQSPAFKIDISLRHATEAELSAGKPNHWHT
jgi:TPR repeat protein